MAAKQPATSAELAERAGLDERYVREWLGAMTTGGVFTYDAETGAYKLPPEHAALLTGHTAANAAPMSQILIHFGTLLPRLIECFRNGGGIPYSAFRPEFTERMDDVWRRIYDEKLVDGFIAPVAGLPERLQAGIAAADIGCGTGHAANLLARAYPASRFVGYDIATDAIAAATAEAEAMGLPNSRFEVLDVTRLPSEPKLDLITAFDAIHDQVDPAARARQRPARAGRGWALRHDRLQVRQQRRGQRRQSVRAALLRHQHDALHDDLARRRRCRARARSGASRPRAGCSPTPASPRSRCSTPHDRKTASTRASPEAVATRPSCRTGTHASPATTLVPRSTWEPSKTGTARSTCNCGW